MGNLARQRNGTGKTVQTQGTVLKHRGQNREFLTPAERLRRVAALLVKAMYLAEDLRAKGRQEARDGKTARSVSYPPELPESGAFEESQQAVNGVHGARARRSPRRRAP